MKKSICLILALLMLLALAACGQQTQPQTEPAQTQASAQTPQPDADAPADTTADAPAAEYDKVTITVSNFNPQDSSYGKAMDAFAEYMSEKSGGAVTVDVYHAGALGAEKECAEGVYEGSIDMMFSGTGGIGNYIPATAAVECWFVIDSVDQVQEVIAAMDEDFTEAFDEAGFVYLGCFYDGPRQMCSTKEVDSIDDLKGFKWRVPTSTIYVNSAEALGASAVAMSLGEVYTSLQTGAIDALEGTLDSIVTYKYYEQAKYIVETAHTYQPLFIFYNKANFEKLSPDTQALIKEGVKYAEDIQIQLWKENMEVQREFLEEQGVEFITLTDRDKWVEAVDQSNYDYCKSCGDLGLVVYDTIKEVSGK